MKDFDLTKNIQIISVIVLCGAVLKHQIYYAYFHIPIYKYIDFSEIIPLFLDQVLVISILVVIFTIFAYLTSGYKTELHQKIYLEENFRKRLKIIYKNAPISLKIITILIYILIVVDLFFGNNPFNKVMTIMTGMIPLLVILILEISYKKNKVEGEKLSNLTILYIILIYFYVISIISFTSIEVYNIKDKGSEYTTSIQFNDSCITFNDPSYIIGNTRNYLFYYDGDKKETNIYPMTEIKKISFKEIEYKKEKEIRERNKKGVVLDSLKSKDTLNF